LGKSLIAAGHSIEVVAVETSNAILNDHGIEVHRVTSGILHWYISKLPLLGKWLAQPVRELEYGVAAWRGARRAHQRRPFDIIEGTETGMLLLALFWKRCPIVIRLHGEQYTFHKYTPGMGLTLGLRLARVFQRTALRRAKLLISPSYAHAREIHHELGFSHPPIVVVPNGVLVHGLERNGQQRNTNTVLYAGRIEKNKGITTLLRAAAQTRNAIPDARFLIAGDFHSSLPRAEFSALVRANNLESNLNVLGPVAGNALADLYKCSTVAVLPSHYETFGLAALEPMVFGTPVIANNSAALPEIVIPEVNGKLVPPGDETALAAAMIELLRNPEACRRMGDAAMSSAARFDIRNVVSLTERLYSWCNERSWESAGRHIFFSPHPDDAALSCGGTIHSLVSQRKRVQVITVFADDSNDEHSAFTRHLHQKWGGSDASSQRIREDSQALRSFGVNELAYWDYVEAPERRTSNRQSLYATYDELSGMLAQADHLLIDHLVERISALDISSCDTAFYFPLSLGNHVDHQILFAVGYRLAAAGRRVRFYEDYPYAGNYNDEPGEFTWLSRQVAIPLETKLQAVSAYRTQILGLGGSAQNLRRNLTRFSSRLGGEPAERFWEFATSTYPNKNGTSPKTRTPLLLRERETQLRDIKGFAQTFRWHDLDEVLPPGTGDCLDIGCGTGRHKSLIESRGYRWIGLDRSNATACVTQGDLTALPVQSHSKAAVVAWQALEYTEQPEKAFAEAARVLEPGGVFCGSVSFLEPVHGHSYFNLSPLIVEKLLRENGFGDVTIKSGLNGFALMFWTWLRRTPIPHAKGLAVLLAFLMFAPLAATLFFASWLSQRIGFGKGHLMRWVSQTAPLEFAGHVMFCARKRARLEKCTSHS
jgi:glycosyltransferase involved in cell wall biosynthesis/SAM-dependent methyltransferase